MGKNWLRTAGVVLLFGSMMILLALLIGQLIPTNVVTNYHIQWSIRYPVIIHDPARSLGLQLAGSRCFRELPAVPEWSATRHQYEPSYYPAPLQVNAQAADALKQLRC